MDESARARSRDLEHCGSRQRVNDAAHGMRVGVVADTVSPDAGGVFTFVGAIVDAIRECSSDHEFVVWEAAAEREVKRRWRAAVKRGAEIFGTGRLIRSAADRIS